MIETAVAMTVAFLGLAFWCYHIQTTLNDKLMQMSISVSDALQTMKGEMNGHKDHITAIRVDVELMEKTLAESLKSLDTDEISRIKDRLGFVELANGIRKGDKSKAS